MSNSRTHWDALDNLLDVVETSSMNCGLNKYTEINTNSTVDTHLGIETKVLRRQQYTSEGRTHHEPTLGTVI